jgi:hypothetical protein
MTRDRPQPPAAASAPRQGRLLPASAHPSPHLRRDWAHPCHICAGTRLTRATSAPGLGSPRPHLPQDWADPRHICAGTKPARAGASHAHPARSRRAGPSRAARRARRASSSRRVREYSEYRVSTAECLRRARPCPRSASPQPRRTTAQTRVRVPVCVRMCAQQRALDAHARSWLVVFGLLPYVPQDARGASSCNQHCCDSAATGGNAKCISCDILGDFFQSQPGQTKCIPCPAGTQRYIGQGSGAFVSSCMCKAGAPTPSADGPGADVAQG